MQIEYQGEEYDLDMDTMTVGIVFDTDDWDGFMGADAHDMLEAAAENSNDLINDEVEEALAEHGFCIDTDKPHSMEWVGSSKYVINYHFKKA